MRFESKARNLQNLIGKLKSAKILPLIIINKDDDKIIIIQIIKIIIMEIKIIVIIISNK